MRQALNPLNGDQVGTMETFLSLAGSSSKGATNGPNGPNKQLHWLKQASHKPFKPVTADPHTRSCLPPSAFIRIHPRLNNHG